jgi:hypothetical protein
VADNQPYNPLDKHNLGDSVVRALLERTATPLDHAGSEGGAGVYVLYYAGGFPEYASIAKVNRDKARRPIYVGKAIPKGGRRGGLGFDAASGNALRSRLIEHRESLMQVSNLKAQDFRYRALMLDDIWIPLAENMLIERFKPVWNLIVDGFGNHDPGRGRSRQDRSPWDVLHPGRPWAERLQTPLFTRDDVTGRLSDSFEGRRPRGLPRRKRTDDDTGGLQT